MKSAQFYICIFILIVITSCTKTNEPVYPYEARVLGVNTDCGTYAIQFLSLLDKIETKFGNSPVQGVYIGKNLPVELQEENLIIQLDCRVPEADEVGVCTTLGPSYGWVFITEVRRK